ncbi:MAG: FMN-binding negative transcriptional regulator [Rhizobiaceae bacterium]
MHPNQAFRKESEERNIAFLRDRAFGVLAVNADTGPLVSHVPFLLSPDAGEAELHLVRSNPILRMLAEPKNAILAVSGGDAYISPDWYWVADQVPTWNYVAVHIRGELSILDNSELDGVLRRLAADMENRLFPKKPWTSDKMTAEVYEKMKRQIVPVRLAISEINGTWKLSQNKPDNVRISAAEGVSQSGIGSETDKIEALMRSADSQ